MRTSSLIAAAVLSCGLAFAGHSENVVYTDGNLAGINPQTSAVLDLSQDKDRAALHSLLAKADLLVHNVAPSKRHGFGLASERLAVDFPQLVIAAISGSELSFR